MFLLHQSSPAQCLPPSLSCSLPGNLVNGSWLRSLVDTFQMTHCSLKGSVAARHKGITSAPPQGWGLYFPYELGVPRQAWCEQGAVGRGTLEGAPIIMESTLLIPKPSRSSAPSCAAANSSNLSSAAACTLVIGENQIWQNGRKSACMGLFSKTQLKRGIGLENEPFCSFCSLLNSGHSLPAHAHWPPHRAVQPRMRAVVSERNSGPRN